MAAVDMDAGFLVVTLYVYGPQETHAMKTVKLVVIRQVVGAFVRVPAMKLL